MMNEHVESPIGKDAAIEQWQVMLQDEAALLAHPGGQHKALLMKAHALHQAQVIDSDDLSDLLEQAGHWPTPWNR